jgi:hypothetical protein
MERETAVELANEWQDLVRRARNVRARADDVHSSVRAPV